MIGSTTRLVSSTTPHPQLLQEKLSSGLSMLTAPVNWKLITGAMPLIEQGRLILGTAKFEHPFTHLGLHSGVLISTLKQQVLPFVFTVPFSTKVALKCQGPASVIRKNAFVGRYKS